MNLLRSFCLLLVCLLGSSFMPLKHGRYEITKVVIDAGHGGHDVGCLGRNGGKEKDVALAVALKLGEYIETHFKDVQVIYTRKTDVFVELHERAAIANNANANLFICVHCNSACYRDKRMKREICSEEAFGAETWVMGLNKSEANLEVSKRENEVVLMEKDYSAKYDGFDPNSPEANIIFSLYQNTFLDQSLKFASQVQQEMKATGRQVRGVKQAGFLVLYKTTMPSVLVETGFLTNSLEEKYLTSSKGQDELARAIYNAFKAYKHSIDGGQPAGSEARKADPEPVKEEKPVSQQKEVVVPKEQNQKEVKKDPAPSSDTMEATAHTEVKVPSTEKAKPAESAVSTTGELFYSVQILTSPGSLKNTNPKFKGVEVWEDKVPGMFKYCTGKLKSFSAAMSLQKEMKAKGFQDAFVVVYRNGQRITLQEAKRIAAN